MSDAPPACWVITREADDGRSLVDQLVVRGADARLLPCIERNARPWPAELLPATAGRTVVFVTSAFAARLVVDHGARARWSEHVDIAAVVPATADVFARAGLPVVVHAAGGSVALAHAVVDDAARAPIARILYPTSDAGLDAPEQAQALALLQTVSPDVRRGAVYGTAPPPDLARDLRRLPRPLGAVFFSPSAVDAFVDAWGDVAGDGAFVDVCAVCSGASTARAWTARTRRAAVPVVPGGSIVDAVVSTIASASFTTETP